MPRNTVTAAISLAFAIAAGAAVAAVAASTAPVGVTFTLRQHRFIPDTATAPAGAKVIVTLINEDASAEEFASSDLHVEEDVTPKARIRFSVGPFKPGVYRFMGEGHPETASGRLVIVAP